MSFWSYLIHWQITCSRHRTLQNIWIPILQIFVLVYWRGTRKHFNWSKKYFRPIKNVFLSPLNKEKQKFGELELEYFGGFDVVNKLKISFLVFTMTTFVFYGQPRLLFWKLVNETQMSKAQEYTSNFIKYLKPNCSF